MGKLQRLGVMAAVLATSLCLAPAALAQSTDLYPAGDSVSASASPVTIGGTTCTFNPGVFTTPTKGNPSGPLTGTFTTRPTYSGCTAEHTIETSGTWTISEQYGSGAATITIPVGGFKMSSYGGLLTIINTASAWTLTGVWNNGFSSPVKVASSVDLYPSKNTYYSEGAPHELTFGSTLGTLSDVTHPGDLLLLGP
jgi:hypothetical protein